MAKPVILVVDDEASIRDMLRFTIGDDYEALTAKDGFEALDIIRKKHMDLVLLDVMLPGMDGIETLEKIKGFDADIGVIMISGKDRAETAVSALKKGAYDYVAKPFNPDDLLSTIRRYIEAHYLKTEVEYLKEELRKDFVHGEFVSRSQKMREVFRLIDKVARTSSTVLVTGESGTGKELVARAIHSRGERSGKPFVAVNCGAVPSELMESELFGHEKGSFTGAHSRKIGRFEYADGGTVFLDEISTLPMHLQTRLLRVLQDKTFERVGSNIPIKVDVMVIAATNMDLSSMVREGRFREDLFYRLKVVPIELPPLRERSEDIPILIHHFLRKHGRKCNKLIKGITADAINALRDYPWPGNIRELENLMERLVVMAKDGDLITYDDLPQSLFQAPLWGVAEKEPEDYHDALRAFEKRFITGVLFKTNWNRSEAARLLNIHRNTLLMKMKSLGIRRGDNRHKEAN